MINNSTEQSINEITPLLQQNVTDTSFWQRFMPTRECILNFKPARKDIFCCGATALSVLSFSTIGFCLGSLGWAIKNNTAIDFNNVNSISGVLFLLGIVVGLRYGIKIGDCFLNLISSNSEENENLLNNSNSNDSREILQEVIITDKDGNRLLISENATKTSQLLDGSNKIEQTFKVETKKDEEQQPKNENNNEIKQIIIKVNQAQTRPAISNNQQPSTSKGLGIINL